MSGQNERQGAQRTEPETHPSGISEKMSVARPSKALTQTLNPHLASQKTMNTKTCCSRNSSWIIAPLLAALLVTGCGSNPKSTHSASNISLSSLIPDSISNRGGYYQDDGPHSQVPPDLAGTPDAVPIVEPYRRSNSRPYHVLGKSYVPITDNRPFTERGIGSWYGKKFHGNQTASGERYDMYKMTAAHPTLPIPSYARVTNLSNGKNVIVRINDRGPFHAGRIIDLSYTAALKLGYIQKGHESVQVERLLPHDIRRMQATQPSLSPTKHGAPQDVAQNKYLKKPTPTRSAGLPTLNAPAGIHLQLGSFSQKYYAETLRDRYAAAWSGQLPAAKVIRQNAVYRLYAGPFANRELADSAARQIQLSGMAKPLIVQR